MHAALNRCYSVCEMLIKRGANVHTTSKNGKTAFLYSLRNSSMSISKLLLKHGANPNLTENFSVDIVG